nr:MAG TPA: hypothetical protein [Caudoviricetes sp.]
MLFSVPSLNSWLPCLDTGKVRLVIGLYQIS